MNTDHEFVYNNVSQQMGPVISVRGCSLLPFCHFELEDSDYLSANRRHVTEAADAKSLDPNTRVIEFRAVGRKSLANHKFSIVNPTNKEYAFQWICEDALQPTDVQVGKKIKMCEN